MERKEKDVLGEVSIDDKLYYGVKGIPRKGHDRSDGSMDEKPRF